MADTTQQVVVEFVSDTSQLQSGIDQLQSMGDIDAGTAAVFKKTNDQLKARNDLIKTAIQGQDQLSVGVTEQQAIYNKLVASVKNLTGASKEAVQTLLKMSAGQVAQGFQQAAVNVDDYVAALEGATTGQDAVAKSSTTLRTQILQLTNQLAELTAAGEGNSAQYNDIALKVGKLKNALKDTQQTVANLGSDVPTLKIFAAAASGITGAFTAATGAAALFGDQNQELQEVLVKVNAVMAINAGLGQLLNLVRDEAAISTAKILVQEALYDTQLAIENGLQSESVIARTAATVAQVALNAAMAVNPGVLVIAAIAGLVAAFVKFSSSARQTKQQITDLNDAISLQKKLVEDDAQSFGRLADEQAASLGVLGAKQSAIIEAQGEAQAALINRRNEAIAKQQENANTAQLKLAATGKDEFKKAFEDATAEIDKLENANKDSASKINELRQQKNKQLQIETLQGVVDTLDAELNLTAENSVKKFAIQQKLNNAESALAVKNAGEDTEAILRIQAEASKKSLQIELDRQKFVAEQKLAVDQIAATKADQQAKNISDRQTKAQLDAQNQLALDELSLQLKNLELTSVQKLALTEQTNAKIADNNREFEKQQQLNAIADQESLEQITLQNSEATNQEKLNANIKLIVDQADAEIIANKGKNDKIREIEAKRDQDIKLARIQSIEDELQIELQLDKAKNDLILKDIDRTLKAQDQIRTATGIGGRKAVAQITGVHQESFDTQADLIDKQTDIQAAAIQKQIDANKAKNDILGGQDADLLAQQADLQSQKDQIIQAGQDKQVDLALKARQIQQDKFKETANDAIQGAQVVFNFIQSIGDAADKAEQQRIDTARSNIQALQDAGDISAKEAAARNKKLDQDEKNLQREQARRAKALAIFNAIISTAQAVVTALTAGPIVGVVLAAVTAALGAAQIAIIAARPIPQFKTGKHGNYEGLGLWGEAGAELMQRDGRMYVASKPTLTYIERDDVIYNPRETAAMMAGRVASGAVPSGISAPQRSGGIDYDRLGQTIAANTRTEGVMFDKDGHFHDFVQQGSSFTKYLNKRRRWG
jgi:hypothetical protein